MHAKMKQQFIGWLCLALLASTTVGATPHTLDHENIAQLISTTDLSKFHPKDTYLAKKIKFLLFPAHAHNTTDYCIIDLNEQLECQHCSKTEHIPNAVTLDCGHHYHPVCFLQAFAHNPKRAAETGDLAYPTFACPTRDCEGSLLSEVLKSTLKDAGLLDKGALIPHILPHLQSFLPCRSCQAGGILSMDATHKYFGVEGSCSKCQQKQCFKCDGEAHGDAPCDLQAASQEVEGLKQLIRRKISYKFGYCPQCDHAVIHRKGLGKAHCSKSHAGGCGANFQWDERKTIADQLYTLDETWWSTHTALIAEAEREVTTLQEGNSESDASAEINRRVRRVQLQYIAELIASNIMTSGLWLGPMLIHSAYHTGPLANISLGAGLGVGIPLTVLGYLGYPLLTWHSLEKSAQYLATSVFNAAFLGGVLVIISATTGGPFVNIKEFKALMMGIMILCTNGTIAVIAQCCTLPEQLQHLARAERERR
ncbi:MAG: hypothetical protein OXT67_07920 [Zetaproteobacteria bacterium]|nr:hypothetical protein [Zetaproteobacteria bacterium]